LRSEASLNSFDQLEVHLASYGQVIKSKTSLVFFGQSNLSPNHLFDKIKKVSLLNQVHGVNIIKDPKPTMTADGQYSELSHKALVIKTADCMPVFIEDGDQIIALHIGWRGLAQKFLSLAFELIKNPTQTQLWVGPHIQQHQFELDQISTDQLLKPHGLTTEKALVQGFIKESSLQKNHFFVSLSELMLKEARALGFKNITISKVNTFTSHRHYSHRRNRHQTQRNFSFIMKK